MSGFEAQCDCELDSPGMMSDQPIELRLECWRDWALYLKSRIETHYRPLVMELEWERDRAADIAGIDISELEDTYAHRGNG